MKPNRLGKPIFVALVGAGILLGVLVLLSVGLRISSALGGPGYALFSIPSEAMGPTLRVGDRMLALTNAYGGSPPRHGEIFVFKLPKPYKLPKIEDYVKRVIGLPGDRVQLREGLLILNGQVVERTPLTPAEAGLVDFAPEGTAVTLYRERLPGGASYLIAEIGDAEYFDNTDEIIVPAGKVFMLGDNRDMSADSRMFGFVALDQVHAKPLYICWSPVGNRIGNGIQPEE